MVSVWGLTDKGIVRRENQDSCAYETFPERGLAWGVVCDGTVSYTHLTLPTIRLV